jgi:putative addiction module component (TIGR02574 family)
MSLALNDLEAQIFALPRFERGVLVNRLIQTLDDDSDIEAAWDVEVANRIRDVDAGLVQMQPMNEVMTSLRAEFNR